MGNSRSRARSRTRSVAQTCQPTRLRTRWWPSTSPMPSSRVAARISRALARNQASAAGASASGQAGQRGRQRGAALDERVRHREAAAGRHDGQQGQDRRGRGEPGEPQPGQEPCPAPGRPGRQCLALPRAHGGGAGHQLAGLDLPEHRGARRPPAPRRRSTAPGISVLRAPTVAPAPIRTAPIWTLSPSIHQPDRSTSGSTLAPRPSVSRPVTGGSECSWTSRPIFAPRARA